MELTKLSDEELDQHRRDVLAEQAAEHLSVDEISPGVYEIGVTE